MNGRKAKALRKVIYGDMAYYASRQYMRGKKTGRTVNRPGGLRDIYQKVKRGEIL